ncbi:hypothetical protein DFH11DRAFT_1811933 [Phellopilus nigrolimitatus]|nr:hypothetical protein DFH11DRAFT_1811933 [Phellopilus nigrolimitatus]
MVTQIAGVVVEFMPATISRKGDAYVSMRLVDPSNFEDGFKVIVFVNSRYSATLPSLSTGDAILLKRVLVREFTGKPDCIYINGTVFHEKLQWAAYDSSKKNLVSTKELPIYSAFNPYYKPMKQESQYLYNLGDWWRVENPQMVLESRTRRDHCLLQDCDVNKFFDATVEIVKRVNKAPGKDSLFFFSDYTAHPLRNLTGSFGQWAITASTSSPRVKEADIARMTVGSFWLLKNIRLKIGANNNIEIDLYAFRPYELLDGRNNNDQHFKALLQRKKEYNTSRSFEASPEFSSVSGITYSTSTISFIGDADSGNGVTDLYVTDYTKNALLATSFPKSLSPSLKGYVFHVAVWGLKNFGFQENDDYHSFYYFTGVRIGIELGGGFKGNMHFTPSDPTADERISDVNGLEDPAASALWT